jgi:hypothetical protein
MSGTVKMGTNPADACVDSRFRVFGLQALRVVDMSVVPFVPKYAPSYDHRDAGVLMSCSCHTQSTAYILGELASDVFKEDHGLNRVSKQKDSKL